MADNVGFPKSPAEIELERFQSRIHYHLFDTEEVDQNINSMSFYRNVRGGAFSISGGIKQDYHTNMVDAGKMPANQALLVHRIHLGLVYNRERTDSALDLYEAIFAESRLLIVVQQRTMLDMPTKYIGEDNGPKPFIEADNSAAAYLQEYIKNGEDGKMSAFDLKIPILFKENYAFQVKLDFANAPTNALTTPHYILISLEGELGRPVT